MRLSGWVAVAPGVPVAEFAGAPLIRFADPDIPGNASKRKGKPRRHQDGLLPCPPEPESRIQTSAVLAIAWPEVGAGVGEAEQPQLTFVPRREGTRSAAECSLPWKRSFCSLEPDRNKTVSCRGHHPAFNRPPVFGSNSLDFSHASSLDTGASLGFPERPGVLPARECLQAQRNAQEVPERTVVLSGTSSREGGDL